MSEDTKYLNAYRGGGRGKGVISHIKARYERYVCVCVK